MTYTDWMDCGARKRRACITAPNVDSEAKAKARYEELTSNGMNLLQKIDRGLELRKTFGATYVHEYE